MALARLPASTSVSRILYNQFNSLALLGTSLRYGNPLWTSTSSQPIAISIPAISITIPSFISEIWEGILKAVPKKKTSHMKKRHRQLAGKALKDVHAINSCPGCGRPKKAHFLCPYCVSEIKQSWRQAAKDTAKEGTT